MKSTTALQSPGAALAAGIAPAALSPTAANINEAHRLARSTAESAVAHAVECGRLLAAKKAELPHGEFQAWVEKHCEFSYSTCNRYVKASQNSHAGEISAIRHLFPSGQPGAKSKSKDSPEGAVSVVKERADLRSTEETGSDRPAAPISRDDDPDLAEHDAELARAEREYQERIEKVIDSDDRLAAANTEIKKLAGLYAAVARERDRSINEQTRLTRLLKSAENKVARLEREIEQLRKRSDA